MTLSAFRQYIERLNLSCFEVEREDSGTTFYLFTSDENLMKVVRFDQSSQIISIAVEPLTSQFILESSIRDCIEVGNVKSLVVYEGLRRVPAHAVPIIGGEEDGL